MSSIHVHLKIVSPVGIDVYTHYCSSSIKCTLLLKQSLSLIKATSTFAVHFNWTVHNYLDDKVSNI